MTPSWRRELGRVCNKESQTKRVGKLPLLGELDFNGRNFERGFGLFAGKGPFQQHDEVEEVVWVGGLLVTIQKKGISKKKI